MFLVNKNLFHFKNSWVKLVWYVHFDMYTSYTWCHLRTLMCTSCVLWRAHFVRTLTWTLRAYFARRNLTYTSCVLWHSHFVHTLMCTLWRAHFVRTLMCVLWRTHFVRTLTCTSYTWCHTLTSWACMRACVCAHVHIMIMILQEICTSNTHY